MLKNTNVLLLLAKISYFLSLLGFVLSVVENFFYFWFFQNFTFAIFVSLSGLASFLFFLLLFLLFLPKINPIYWKNSLFNDKRFQKDLCNFSRKKGKPFLIAVSLAFSFLIIFNLVNLLLYGIIYYSFSLVFGSCFSLFWIKFRICAKCYVV
ncbi:hypothetical protein [Mesomycoplasma ovipneumoniae]|uniref:hypothetical protein n=1 Tax=Mesomycoplasma ovipneumoniae TaxID=29562 RepID=UPI00311B0AAD